MTILLDHCVPHRYLRLIRMWSFPVELMSTHIPADSPDTKVIALAQSLDAVLLTVDLDFANILNYPPGQYGGLIVMRYHVQDESALDATLKQALDDLYRDNLRYSLVIIDSTHYRIRR